MMSLCSAIQSSRIQGGLWIGWYPIERASRDWQRSLTYPLASDERVRGLADRLVPRLL